MQITNTTRSDIGLQPDMIIPAGGSLIVNEADVAHLTDAPSIVAHFDAGRLVADADPVTEPAEPTDRAAIIAGIIRGLGDSDFTKGGKPEVDAINAAMVKGADPVTAPERDAVWAGMDA